MPLILPGNVGSATAATGFNVANSCRFNPADSAYMHKTPDAGNRRTFTFSCWVKRSLISSAQTLFWAGSSNDDYFAMRFEANNKFSLFEAVSGATNWGINTNRVFKDISAWYHVVVAVDTRQGTAANRTKIYFNGIQETNLNTGDGYPAENRDTIFNTAVPHQIGHDYVGQYFGGYIAEACFLEGSQNAPTDFGEFDEDSGIWKPIDVSGLTFGNNGFYLDFEDSSALGNDAAGSNNFTVNNLTAVDQSTDTCTNNMPTINQLTLHSNGVTVSEGSLVATTGDAPWQSTNCTFGLTTGKWYWEFKATESSTNQYLVLGIQSDNLLSSAANGFGYSNNYSYGFKNYNGEFVYNETDGGGSGSYGSAVTDGQIIGVALDLVNLEIYFSINGTFQNSGDPTSGSSGTGSAGDLQSGQTYFPSLVIARAGGTGTIPIGEYNFGSPPYSESGGNSDADGYGNFAAAPPSGYFSINTKNLAEYGG